ncbi:MAG: molybdenum ABC transporter ATP-binding protein [Proteobacteria bacterium]|nr:molybdenum ABC transporter ATP-binding protein [Pseudomonadota bacterium]
MSVDVYLSHDFAGFSVDAAFSIDSPGITALFGPSGAGKSTIINAIAGLLRPREGRIVINGREVFDSAKNLFVSPRARHAGYVFQDSRLFPHMSVENNLRFGWRRAEQPASETDIAHVVELLGLAPLLARLPARLSGGERGRVALGRALLSSPELLLLDEPLAALDAARKSEILPYLERLRDETRLPMLYVSHSLEEVSRLADNMIVLQSGRIAAQGSVFELMSDLKFALLLGSQPFGSVIDTRVKEHLPNGLTALEFAGGIFLVVKIARSARSRVRVHIRAEDVMLALEEPKAVSANNVLPARIAAVEAQGAAHANIQLACGEVRLVARITQASLARLDLKPGSDVFAIVKSVTVDPQISAV